MGFRFVANVFARSLRLDMAAFTLDAVRSEYPIKNIFSKMLS